MGYLTASWLPLKGFEGYYEITPSGKIKSVGSCHACKKGILRTWLDKDGYERVGLSKKGKYFQKSMHRLVAENFIPNPDDKPQVNHKNGVRNDNRVENLEWVTDNENKRHSINTLGHSKRGLHGKKVKCVETGETFASQGTAAIAYNTTEGNISRAVASGGTARGKHWTRME